MFRVALACLSVLLLAGCEEICSGVNDCDKGMRCAIRPMAHSGVCTPCDPEETPYDGLDNDCDSSTVDFDLDGDHDNWIGAPENPGNDCNDRDPKITPTIREICEDGKDNDCDMETDEIECRDRLPPAVTITSPTRNQLVTEAFLVTVTATDDIGVARVDLYGDTSLLHTVTQAPYAFTINPDAVVDGRLRLEAIATDVAGRIGSDSVSIQLDLRTPPNIGVIRPLEGRGYDGRMTIDFSAVDDGAGLMSVSAELDGAMLALPPRPPLRVPINTTQLEEGEHVLVIRAIDRAEHAGERTIRFFVDRSPPQINFVEPVENQIISGVVPVVIEALDPSGISELGFNGTSSTTSPLITELDVSPLGAGPQTLTANAIDAAIINDGERIGHATTKSIRVVTDDGSLIPCVGTTPLALTSSTIRGTTIGGANAYEGGCFPTGAPEIAYEFVAPVDLDSLVIDASGSLFPVALHVYRDYCGPSSQLGCATGSLTVEGIARGDRVVIIVDGADATASGAFELTLRGRIHPGQECLPANAALECRYGVCTDSACPGADCLDGIDSDRDGAIDENAATCVAPPILVCPASGDIPVLEVSSLEVIETGAILERQWELVVAPFGSTARLIPDDQRMTSLHPLLAGPYGLRYTALSETYEYSSCETILVAATDDQLRVELIWNPDVPEARDTSDVDLHLLHPDGMTWQQEPLDCFYANPNPSWSTPESDDDPRLDVDDTDGRGPENINIRTPETGRPYRVGVHYYDDHGFGPSAAHVNIYCGGVLAHTAGPVTLAEVGNIWRVADVTFDPAGTCQVMALAAINGGPLITRERDVNSNRR